MTNHLPPGYSTLTPLVVVSPAAEAIDFYRAVFGAVVTGRLDGPDGSVLHAELALEQGRLQVMDPDARYRTVASDASTDTCTFSLAIYVRDTDATAGVAVRHGARLREEPADFAVTGERFASVQDPFGVRWTILTRTVARTDAQVQAALEEWAGLT